MVELIVLREVLVVWLRTVVVGSRTMIENSRSIVLLRLRTAFFRAVIEFGWSAEKRKVCTHLET